MATLDSKTSQSTIELSESNLYSDGQIYVFSTGDARLVRKPLEYQPSDGDAYYPVKIGDTLTRIAYDYYKYYVDQASRYWHVIADANKILNPLDLSQWVGKEIVIPDILRIKVLKDQ